MFIYLDRSLVDCITRDHIPHDILRSLEGLSFMLRTGAHLVSGDRDALIAISSLDGLSLPCKAIFKKAAARCSQALAVFRQVTTYALVDYGRDEIECFTENSIKIIKLPIERILQLSFQPSEIVFEDINDSLIYATVAQWYAEDILNNKHLPLRYKEIQGGGNRTHAIYKAKQEQGDTFCLCITDSDKKYPTDESGDTSRRVREIEDNSMPLSYHLDLEFHEIENLLPLGFLDRFSGTAEAKEIIASLKRAEANGHPEAKLYWDYKKGLRGHYAQGNEDYRHYWCSALGIEHSECELDCTLKQCECFLIKPWPLKGEVKAALDSRPKISPTDCETLNTLWCEIASLFISWAIGAVPQNT